MTPRVQRIWLGGLPYTTLFGGAVLVIGAAGVIVAIVRREILFIPAAFLALELVRIVLLGIQRLAVRLAPKLRRRRLLARSNDWTEVRGMVRVLEPVLAPYAGEWVGAYSVVETPFSWDADPELLFSTTELGKMVLQVGNDTVEIRGPIELLHAPMSVGLEVIRDGDEIVARGRLQPSEPNEANALGYRTNSRSHALCPHEDEPVLIVGR